MLSSQNLSEIITERYNKVLLRDFGITGLGEWEDFIKEIIDTLEIEPSSLLNNLRLTSVIKNPISEIIENILTSWSESHGSLWKGIVKLEKSCKPGPHNKVLEIYTICVSKVEEILGSMNGLEVWEKRKEIKKFTSPENVDYLKLLNLSGKSLIIEW